MIRYEDECCSCATESYPCWGDSCPRRKVPHYFCDHCGHERDEDELTEVQGEYICLSCIVKEARESLLGHVYPVLISREKNKDMLEKTVWKHNSDCPSIAMIYKVMFAGYNVTVSQALCEQFGISKDDLHAAAMNNVSNMKFKIINLAERFFDFDDYESLPSEMMMFAVTNDKYIYGANAMLRTDIFNDIKNRIGTDIYIIPSSIHEIIVVSAKNAGIDDVKMLVRNVNFNVVDESDFLSDSIFILTQDTVKEV